MSPPADPVDALASRTVLLDLFTPAGRAAATPAKVLTFLMSDVPGDETSR